MNALYVCLHKAGATWTDAQTITHFRNALRNKVVDWFNTLEYSGVNTSDNNWNAIKERFEIDNDAKPTFGCLSHTLIFNHDNYLKKILKKGS